MSHLRFTIDLAVREPIPQELQAELTGIRNAIRRLKSFSSRINAGNPNEENTTRAVYHRCFHESRSGPCEPEREI